LNVYAFFFSSRRRHTRFSRDWSSDVCSSDLLEEKQGLPCAGAVVAGADINGARQSLLFFQHRIVTAVEEILHGAGHIAEVFGGAEEDGIGAEYVLRAGVEGCLADHRYAVDIFVGCAAQGGVPQGAGVL